MVAYFFRKDLKYKSTLLIFDYISTLRNYVFVDIIIVKPCMYKYRYPSTCDYFDLIIDFRTYDRYALRLNRI